MTRRTPPAVDLDALPEDVDLDATQFIRISGPPTRPPAAPPRAAPRSPGPPPPPPAAAHPTPPRPVVAAPVHAPPTPFRVAPVAVPPLPGRDRAAPTTILAVLAGACLAVLALTVAVVVCGQPGPTDGPIDTSENDLAMPNNVRSTPSDTGDPVEEPPTPDRPDHTATTATVTHAPTPPQAHDRPRPRRPPRSTRRDPAGGVVQLRLPRTVGLRHPSARGGRRPDGGALHPALPRRQPLPLPRRPRWPVPHVHLRLGRGPLPTVRTTSPSTPEHTRYASRPALRRGPPCVQSSLCGAPGVDPTHPV